MGVKKMPSSSAIDHEEIAPSRFRQDVSMSASAAFSVAVGNASAAAKAAASHVSRRSTLKCDRGLESWAAV